MYGSLPTVLCTYALLYCTQCTVLLGISSLMTWQGRSNSDAQSIVQGIASVYNNDYCSKVFIIEVTFPDRQTDSLDQVQVHCFLPAAYFILTEGGCSVN